MIVSVSVIFDLHNLPHEVLTFLERRHLATLSVKRPDGSPHVTPVGVTYQAETRTARVITWATSYKALTIGADPEQKVAVCQVDGGRWLTIYGRAKTTDDAGAVAEAVRRYTKRYRPPGHRADRVVIEIAVDRIAGQV